MEINDLWNWANNSIDQPVAYDNTTSLYTLLSRIKKKLDDLEEKGIIPKWGNIEGNIEDQTDLITKLNELSTQTDWGKIKGNIEEQTDLINLTGSLQAQIDYINNISYPNLDKRIESADKTAVWGNVTGTLTDQTDLITLLNGLRTDINGLITLTKPKIAPQLTNIAFTMVGAGGANPGYLLLRVDFDENLKVTTDVVLSDVQVQYQQKGASNISLMTVPIAPGKTFVGTKDTFNPTLIPNRYGFGFDGSIPLTNQTLKDYVIQGIGIAFTITVNGQSRRLFNSYNIGRGDL